MAGRATGLGPATWTMRYGTIQQQMPAINIHIQVKRKPQRPTGISVVEICRSFTGSAQKWKMADFMLSRVLTLCQISRSLDIRSSCRDVRHSQQNFGWDRLMHCVQSFPHVRFLDPESFEAIHFEKRPFPADVMSSISRPTNHIDQFGTKARPIPFAVSFPQI
jgi:hypothetical protein